MCVHDRSQEEVVFHFLMVELLIQNVATDATPTSRTTIWTPCWSLQHTAYMLVYMTS